MNAQPEWLHGSKWTPHKEQEFARMITIYARIAAAIQRKHTCGRWLYADLTAGSGNIIVGDDVIDGSPLWAMRAFADAGLEVDCVLIEKNAGRAAALEQVVVALHDSLSSSNRERVRYKVYALDHRPHLLTDKASQEFGLLYWDGLGEDRYPAEELQAWLARHRMHDVLGMASGCAPKRMGATRLDSLLHTTVNGNGRRRSGYISEPQGAWEWVFVLLTAWPPLAARLAGKGLPMFDFLTSDGQRILDRVATTEREREQRARGEWQQLWDDE